MKAKRISLIVAVLFCTYSALGQQSIPNTNVIAQPLALSYAKTTTIVFPFAIKSVDRGSQDILVQKALGLENVLQIKAAQQGFPETNLTVITADGKVYGFEACYDESPSLLTLTFPETKNGNLIQFSEDRSNEKKLEDAAEFAFHDRKRINGLGADNYGIKMSITGLYIHDDLLYYRMKIANETNISYDIDQLRFFIKDQKRAKRTASQEVEIVPVAMHKQIEKIPAKSARTFVVILPKFTIPDKKNLVIQLVESKGGRHMELAIRHQRVDNPSPF